MRTRKLIITILICITGTLGLQTAVRAETTLFPANSFGVAGPIPTPPNLGDLVGPPMAGTAVTFDPGDLGFLMFDMDISGAITGTPNLGIRFNITSAIASGSGDSFISVLLGNIGPTGPGGGLAFAIATTPGLTDPNGAASIFQFTQIDGAGIFTVDTTAFVAGCLAIGGCNTIVIGTSGLGAAGGGAFADGGTLTFSSVIAASPEPSTWALMIMGFFGVAWQAKAQRRRNREHGPSLAPGQSLAPA